MAQDSRHSEFGLLEALPLAVVVCTAQGRCIWVSRQGRAMLGPFDDFATALNDLTADTRFDDWQRILCELPQSDGPVRFLHVNCHGRDGQAGVVNLSLSRLAEPDRPDCLVALLEDATPLADLERRLAHSERLASMGKFSARLAHELNNPLDGILRYVNLAIRLCDRLEERRPAGYLLQARRGLMRMVHIIAELLDFSRTSDATLVEDRIDHIIDEVLNSLGPRAADSAIIFQRRFAPNLPFIRTGNLYQLFVNLVCNAIEAMPSGGTLTVTAEVVADNVVVSFADTGVGLPPGQVGHIFEPFFTTKPAGRGTGLGLAICREVIEKYHGSISAADRPKGGAVITVSIPLASCQTAADLHLPRSLAPPQTGA